MMVVLSSRDDMHGDAVLVLRVAHVFAVLSDMAHNFMGIARADHAKQLSLAWDAFNFSQLVRLID